MGTKIARAMGWGVPLSPQSFDKVEPCDDFDAEGWHGFDTADHAAAASIAICHKVVIDGDDLRFALTHAGLRLVPIEAR